MSKRKIKNCSLIKKGNKKGIGIPAVENGKCVGYSNVNDDEPCLLCQACELNTMFEDEE